MASIGSVELKIEDIEGTANAVSTVTYSITQTDDDIASGRTYQELVQLFVEGRRVGEPGIEHPVPGGTVWDGTVVFTNEAVKFDRSPQLPLPLNALNQNESPLQQAAVRARVTLTPLPPGATSVESNVVELSQPPVVEA